MCLPFVPCGSGNVTRGCLENVRLELKGWAGWIVTWVKMCSSLAAWLCKLAVVWIEIIWILVGWCNLVWLAEGKYISTYRVFRFRDLRMFIQRNCYLCIFFQRFISLSPGDELFCTTFSKVVIIISYSFSNFMKKENFEGSINVETLVFRFWMKYRGVEILSKRFLKLIKYVIRILLWKLII